MQEKDHDELMGHDFDGIREFDNDLPPWWLKLFYVTVLWGVLYLVYYHVGKMGDLQIAEYQQEIKSVQVQAENSGGAGGGPVMRQALTDKESLFRGRDIFRTNCQACHGAVGQGGVGPNLTDEYWIHGGTFPELAHIITVGVPAKGMVAWGSVLKAQQISEVASFVLTLQGTNPPNAKAPEGTKVE